MGRQGDNAMRILIIGAAGSLGRQLAPHLAARGHEVVCFDLQRPASEPPPSCRWVTGDLLLPHALAEAAEGCAALVHIPCVGYQGHPFPSQRLP
jgi:uronate dehydrogenase